MKKNPSKTGISAASVKGDAGPAMGDQGGERKRNSQNNQYKR